MYKYILFLYPITWNKNEEDVKRSALCFGTSLPSEQATTAIPTRHRTQAVQYQEVCFWMSPEGTRKLVHNPCCDRGFWQILGCYSFQQLHLIDHWLICFWSHHTDHGFSDIPVRYLRAKLLCLSSHQWLLINSVSPWWIPIKKRIKYI